MYDLCITKPGNKIRIKIGILCTAINTNRAATNIIIINSLLNLNFNNKVLMNRDATTNIADTIILTIRLLLALEAQVIKAEMNNKEPIVEVSSVLSSSFIFKINMACQGSYYTTGLEAASILHNLNKHRAPTFSSHSSWLIPTSFRSKPTKWRPLCINFLNR